MDYFGTAYYSIVIWLNDSIGYKTKILFLNGVKFMKKEQSQQTQQPNEAPKEGFFSAYV